MAALLGSEIARLVLGEWLGIPMHCAVDRKQMASVCNFEHDFASLLR